MSKHTLGPWHLSPTCLGAAFDIGAEDGSNVALVSGPQRNGAEEFHANALLIAAAPDMLKALKTLDAWWTDEFPRGPDGDYSDRMFTLSDDTKDIWRRIRTVIAETEGGPNG